MPRVIHCILRLLNTNEAPNSAIPSRAAGSTNIHGTRESGVRNGRATARAIRHSNKQRAAINNRSSHSILRRRTEMVSNKKRIAPQSIGLAA